MKKIYIAPKSEEFELKLESVMCLSYGGNGDGRPAYSDRQEPNIGMDLWNEEEEETDSFFEN